MNTFECNRLIVIPLHFKGLKTCRCGHWPFGKKVQLHDILITIAMYNIYFCLMF